MGHALAFRAFRIVHNQREAFRAGRRMAPDQRRRGVFTGAVGVIFGITGEFFLHHGVIGEIRRLQNKQSVCLRHV